MIIAPIVPDEARGLVCAEGGDQQSFCHGALWQVRLKHQAGPIVACETHLFRLGRGIADALKDSRTLSETSVDSTDVDGKKFTWG